MWKNKQGLMILNQQRQDTKTRAQPGMVMYESPGGEALHHNMAQRIHLKPGRNRYTVAQGSGKDRETEVLVGRELVCTFKKNKLAMNTKAARFDYFHIPTEQYGFGLDKVEDIIRTCKVAGVIGGSAVWLEHHSFPKGKVNGKPGLAKALKANPEIEGVLREEMLAKMREEQARLRAQAANGVVAENHEPETEEKDDGETGNE
jgi:recombination protein RecA